MSEKAKLFEKRTDFFIVPLTFLWLIAPFVLIIIGNNWGAVAYSVCQLPILILLNLISKDKKADDNDS